MIWIGLFLTLYILVFFVQTESAISQCYRQDPTLTGRSEVNLTRYCVPDDGIRSSALPVREQ